MARKRKRRGDGAATEAPVEVAQQEAPAAAADSAAAAKTGRPRGSDATAEQEASAAVHAPGPADSGKETTDVEGKKPKRTKKKKKTDQSPRPPASNADAAATGKSGDDCTDGVGVLGDAEVTMNPRNGDHPERKKPKRGNKKKNMQQPSPSAVSDGNAVELDKSTTDCKDVENVLGDDETIRSPRNEEDPGFSVEQDIPERKKPRRKKRKNNKQEQSPSAVTDGGTIVVGTSGNDCTHGKGVPGVADVSMSSRNGEDQDCPEVNIGEKGAPERKKPKRRQKKKNMQQPSPSAVSNGNAVELDKSRTDCKDVEDVPGDDETIRSPRNEEDPGFSAEQDIPQRKKPRRKKWKNNKQEQSPSAVTDGDAIVVGTSGNDCTHGNGVPRVADVTMSSRNGEDQDCPEVSIAEKETPGRKKPKLKKRKENKERSTATVSDDGAVLLHKSENDCIDGDDASGDAQVSVSTTNVEDPYCPEVNIAEKGTNERKKPKLKKRKENKERSTATVSDDGAVLLHKSENDCIDGDDASGDAQVSVSTTNVEDPYCPEVNIAEKGTNERKKPKPKKRKENKERSTATVSDDGAVLLHKSENDCIDGDDASADAQVSVSTTNVEDPYCPEVNIAEKGTNERKKPKPKKRKENKERSTATVSDDGAVLLHKSENDCIDGDDASADAQVSVSTTNVEDPYCPEVNIAEKGTNERKKPKPKKGKNKKEGSSSVILDAGAVVADESRNSCKDGDCAPRDIEASISPPNGDDSVCPAVNNAENGIPEMNKPKWKKQKKNNQQPSPSAVLDATDVVMDKSGHDSTNVGAPSGASDVTISPRIGEGPEYTKLNSTDDFLEENKVNKDYSQKSKLKKQMKNKHEQSPSALLDTCAVVEDKSGNSYVDGKGSLGATDISTSPRTGKDHDCPEVNIANDLVEVKNGNNNNSQKPKNRERKRKKMAPVAGTETPPVGGVSSDERKDAFETGSMKVTAKSTIISMTSTSGENYKENVRDIYSPEGSLVRFQRKKLLILDINGILADINTDRDVAHMADGRVRGKNVFKRYYLDDFLRFCFQNFELGIWSSRMKVNVDAVLDILMKDLRRHLLFFWDASQCTTTNRGTLENRYKPLVLKELKKLWNKEDPDLPWEQGEFSPSNTLLVDDSPYKALRNPPHTAIFPQPYSYHMEEDESLGPGGDLRVYLENIAAADDVQRYVQEHPFGQPSITESHPHWNFYAKIHCTG
ncbi:uncharacterized protein LOC124670449 [Lolium rigidum]|uniref:uncharacterized protein LOC124670449 n=1 Tax=Lolium rigidum TaxID=89674 RepID=UPI001F5E0D40|nr:uncharacterized protein LOC124670449 [Lolium rigidum]